MHEAQPPDPTPPAEENTTDPPRSTPPAHEPLADQRDALDWSENQRPLTRRATLARAGLGLLVLAAASAAWWAAGAALLRMLGR